MSNILIISAVVLSMFIGFIVGFEYRGSKFRKARLARKEAIRRAAKSLDL